MNLQEATIKALQGKLNEEIKNLPDLEFPYYMSESNGRYYISSRHPYDSTDYSFAVTETNDINGMWKVYVPNKDYSIYLPIEDRPKQNVFAGKTDGWKSTVEMMKKLDLDMKPNIDRT